MPNPNNAIYMSFCPNVRVGKNVCQQQMEEGELYSYFTLQGLFKIP